MKKGETALVVSPTHFEGDQITTEIRTALQRDGRVGKDQHVIRRLENLQLTPADRGDGVSYVPGDIVELHQNATGYQKGQQVEVGRERLPLDQAARFQVDHAGEIALAAGDVIRVTKNGQTADKKHRLNNGALYRIRGISKRGDIVLDNGGTMARDFGHLAYGYVVTSHSSQGQTVDHVFIGQSSASLGASSREQFYVSASRGRKQVTIYTDDKASWLQAVSHSDERLTATEMVAQRQPQRIRKRTTTLRDKNSFPASTSP